MKYRCCIIYSSLEGLVDVKDVHLWLDKDYSRIIPGNAPDPEDFILCYKADKTKDPIGKLLYVSRLKSIVNCQDCLELIHA